VAGNSVGEATIDIVADAKNFEKDLTGQVEKATKAAEPAAEKGGVNIGDAIGRGLITTGKVVGAGLAAALGASLVSGFNRLKVIDQAEAKLLGLGNSAEEVVGIMDQALKSVEGTAFGLGDAADLAARFMAAGVTAGEDLQLALDSTTDAAAVTGKSLAEMGDIMGDIAAEGELTGQSMNRLGQAGIDATDQLVRAYGLTRDEAEKMVADGEVSFEMFAEALQKNIGTASEKSADTFSGAMKNIGAALARLGATILKPIFEGIIAIAPTVIAAINGFADAFKPIFEKIGPAVEQAFEKIAAALAKVDWEAVGTAVASMAAVMGAAILAVLPVIRKLVDVFGPPLQLALKAVSALLEAMPWEKIIDLVNRLGPLIVALLAAFKGFKAASAAVKIAGVAFQVLTGKVTLATLAQSKNKVAVMLTTTATKIQTVAVNGLAKAQMIAGKAAKALGAAFKFMTGPIGLIITGITLLVGALIWFFTQTEMGRQMWGQFVDFMMEKWNQFVTWIVPVIQRFAAFFIEVWNLIVSIVVPIVTALVDFLIRAWDAFVAIWEPIWEGVKSVIIGAWTVIEQVIIPIVQMIVDFLRNTWEAFIAFFGPIWDRAKEIVSTAWDVIKNVIMTVVDLIVAIISGDLSAVVDIINGIWEDVKAGTQRIWDNIIEWIREIPTKIKNVFTGAARWLYSAGQDILRGLWDGLKSIWGNIESWFTGKIDGLVSKAQSLLKIGSPSKVFHEMGEQVAQGFINGVDGMSKQIEATANVFAQPAHSLTTGPGAITGRGASSTAGATTSAGATTTFAEGAVQVNGVGDPYKAALLAVNGVAERVAL
jgi:tape measure domain-containing protein